MSTGSERAVVDAVSSLLLTTASGYRDANQDNSVVSQFLACYDSVSGGDREFGAQPRPRACLALRGPNERCKGSLA
jgi:hypothetical protein